MTRIVLSHSYNDDHVVPDFYIQHKESKSKSQSSSVPPTSSLITHTTSPEPASLSRKFTNPLLLSEDAVHHERQHQALVQRKRDEGALMSELTAGLISGGVSAVIRPRASKIPPEVHVEFSSDGGMVTVPQHPSGFIPPTPGLKREVHTSAVRRAGELAAINPPFPVHSK